MKQLVESDLAGVAGGGYDGDLPVSLPVISTADLQAILALLQPRWPTHLSD